MREPSTPAPGAPARTSTPPSRRLQSSRRKHTRRAVSARSVISRLPALDLGLARLAQLRVGAMREQQLRAFGVVEDAAETVAVAGRGEPRRDPRLAHGIH